MGRGGGGWDRVRWPVFQNLKNEQKFDSANQIPEPVRLVPWLSWLLQSWRGQRGKRESLSGSHYAIRVKRGNKSAGKSRWVWFRFWLVEGMKQNLLANHEAKHSNTYLDKILGDVPSFCNIFTSQSTWVITVLCFFFGLATAPVLLTKWDGTVSSPNYPFTYPTNTTLTWIKTVSSGNRITITIDDFQVRNRENLSQPEPRRSKCRAIPHLFERLFLI